MENKTKLKNQRAGRLLIIVVILITSLLLFGLTMFFFAGKNPAPVNLQAYLKDKDGKPLNGSYAMRFAIYTVARQEVDPFPSDSDESMRVWQEEQTVEVKNGNANFLLGKVNPLPNDLEQSKGYYLGIRFSQEDERVPREKISVLPSMLNAIMANIFSGARTGIMESALFSGNDEDSSAMVSSFKNHNLLSEAHSDTVSSIVKRGDLVVGKDSPAQWSRLPLGASGQFLKSNGADLFWSNLSSSDVGLSNVENTALSSWKGSTNLTTLGTISFGVWQGESIVDKYIASAKKWNRAYSWGDHSKAGYITDGNEGWENIYGFVSSVSGDVIFKNDNISLLNNDAGYLTPSTESDPVFNNSAASGIESTDISNWGDAYTYRLTSASDSGPMTLTLLNNSLSGSINQASSSSDGYLSSSNFQDFSSKQAGSTNLSSLSSLAYSAGAFVRMTGTNTFDLDTTIYQTALTNPVTGTGTANKIAKFTNGTTLGDSQISDDGSKVGIGTDTPNSKFQTTGSVSSDYQIVTNNTTLNENYHTVEVNSPANTITLPSAVNIKGREYIIKNYSNSAVTIATSSSQTIDGKNSWTLNDKESLIIVSDNANWKVMTGYNNGGIYVGMTSLTTNGSFSYGGSTGYKAGNAMCNAQYSNSHMCRTDEIINTISREEISGFSGTAWIAEGPPGYTSNSNDCNGYTNNASSGYYGAFWEFINTNGGRGWLVNCSVLKAVACCR